MLRCGACSRIIPALTTSPKPATCACSVQVYEQPQYAGVQLPFSIYTLAIANSVLMGGVELFRNSELDPERRCYPGEATSVHLHEFDLVVCVWVGRGLGLFRNSEPGCQVGS